MAEIPGGDLLPTITEEAVMLGCVANLEVDVGPLKTRTLMEISRPGSIDMGGVSSQCSPNAM